MQLNYRQQVAFVGLFIGGIVGALAALLWVDNFSDRDPAELGTAKVGFGDMARIVTATIAVVRQINDMTKLKDESPKTE